VIDCVADKDGKQHSKAGFIRIDPRVTPGAITDSLSCWAFNDQPLMTEYFKAKLKMEMDAVCFFLRIQTQNHP